MEASSRQQHGFYHMLTNVYSAEMTAIWNGIYPAVQIWCNSLLIESDCSILVDEAMQQLNSYVGLDVTSVVEREQR